MKTVLCNTLCSIQLTGKDGLSYCCYNCSVSDSCPVVKCELYHDTCGHAVVEEHDDTDALIAKAVELWGIESQIGMVIEECMELALELHHLRRGKATMTSVLGELADVTLMCKQLEHIAKLSGSGGEYEVIKKAKLDKFRNYINSALAKKN